MEIETIKPLGSLVMIKLEKIDETRASGIFVPNQEQRKADMGTIVKISEDLLGNTEFQIGTKVLFKKWNAEDIHDNKDYILIDVDSIIAIIE